LPDQGSNLDSSVPKTDVLPVTPSGIKVGKCNKIIISYKTKFNND
jgi:hypothetical protein